jgi:hydrogenase maturation protease
MPPGVAAVTDDIAVSGRVGTDAGGVVVGVGNPTMGDDGLGRAVVRRLEDETEAVFAGTTAFFALEAMSGADRAVVVDAIETDDPPGTVRRYPLSDPASAPQVTMHDVTVVDALETCGGVYDLPETVVLVGVVPASVDEGIGLSDAVERAIPAAAATVRGELGDSERDGGEHMDARWYCTDCETEIEASAVDEHEQQGHSVTGRLRPERLLAQDPWETGEEEG